MREPRTADADSHLSAEQARAAAAGLKAMMPIADAPGAVPRPFLDYVLSALADAGYVDVGLVIAPSASEDPQHDEIRRRYEQDAVPSRVRLHWLVQPQALGTADAVLTAEAWVGPDPFVVLNADNLYPVDVLRRLRELPGPGLPVFERDELVTLSNIPSDRVASFALLEVDARGDLNAIVEKPGTQAMAAAGPRAMVSMNVWRFDSRIFDACRRVPKSPRGEFELPMAVSVALERGVRFSTFRARGEVLDLSSRADVAAVSHRLTRREVRV
jgi:dTDP-glucose pyrophosphorylase